MPNDNSTMGERFDERFGDNIPYLQELVSEIQFGDPDFKSLKQFIQSEIDRAVGERDKEWVEYLRRWSREAWVDLHDPEQEDRPVKLNGTH